MPLMETETETARGTEMEMGTETAMETVMGPEMETETETETARETEMVMETVMETETETARPQSVDPRAVEVVLLACSSSWPRAMRAHRPRCTCLRHTSMEPRPP